MKAVLDAILQLLDEKGPELSRKQIVAGFDGFIDSIQKVILSHNENHIDYFQTVEEFGKYISAKKAGGLSLETEEVVKKIGGNVPIMANAMAQSGVAAHCVGAFGYPQIDPVFSAMNPNAILYSFSDPGTTSALEFKDGKIMLAQMAGLNGADWNLLKKRIGLEKIITIFKNSDMICMLNWSEVIHTNDIWKGLLSEVFPFIKNRRRAFFDLSDCSKHSPEKIREALVLIQNFTKYCDVTLSLNKNEANLVYQATHSSSCPEPESLGLALSDFLNIDTLVIHTPVRSLAWNHSAMYQSDTFLIKNPAISTGAGDNFNAGFCLGQLMELQIDQSLVLANLLAASYMKFGFSPGLPELKHFISNVE
ncbi:MAG: hypothetical protein H7096_08955 [Flavobacterium sp.]|nr:hypothetical protein [Pedobacter sp.]